MVQAHIRLGVVLACFLIGCDGANKSGKPETLIEGGYNQQEMDAAIARARAELPKFLEEFQAGNGESFGVKAPITDGKETEHFWLVDIELQGDEFKGRIGNEPGIVKNVREGQEWRIKKSEISDWMFIRDDKIHGNYTMRPLLKTLPPEEAAQWRARLAEL